MLSKRKKNATATICGGWSLFKYDSYCVTLNDIVASDRNQRDNALAEIDNVSITFS